MAIFHFNRALQSESDVGDVYVDEFERKMVDDRLHIVYAGTRNPILGSDPILRIDGPP